MGDAANLELREGNLSSLITRSQIRKAWHYFIEINDVANSGLGVLGKEKVFCILLSDFIRVARDPEIQQFLNFEEDRIIDDELSVPLRHDAFKQYCEDSFEIFVPEDFLLDFNPHVVLPELKFILDNAGILEEENKKSRFILRLAHHEPTKTCLSVFDFNRLKQEFDALSDGEEKAKKFLELRKNIDHYGRSLTVWALSRLDTYYNESNYAGQQDLIIDRQIDETAWFLSMAGLEVGPLNVFLRVVYALEQFYRNKFRNVELSAHAEASDSRFNHLLRCTDINFGTWLRSSAKNSHSELYPTFPNIKDAQTQIFILEEALTVLLHDAVEDTKSIENAITGLDGEEMTPATLVDLLCKAGVAPDMADRLVQRSRLLDKRTPYPEAGETEPPFNYLAYLRRIFNSDDAFAKRAKLADFFQNSQTDLAQPVNQWTGNLLEKCEAWQIIFSEHPEILEFLAANMSPIVVLRWKQFSVRQRVNQTIDSAQIWLVNFNKQVVASQPDAHRTLKSDLQAA